MIQTKNLFSIALRLLLLLTIPLHSNAMLVSKKPSPLLFHRYQNTFHDSTSKITPYDGERDKLIVTKIAEQHLERLVSDVDPHNRHQLCQGIMNDLSNKSSITNVYLLDGKPIGFINYYIDQLLIIAQNLTITSNAHINFLAVESMHHNKGIGSALLQHGLEDLQQRSVHRITLTINDDKLENYYRNFGFKPGRSSKYSGSTQFIKRLQPYPTTLICSAILNYFFKDKNKE